MKIHPNDGATRTLRVAARLNNVTCDASIPPPQVVNLQHPHANASTAEPDSPPREEHKPVLFGPMLNTCLLTLS